MSFNPLSSVMSNPLNVASLAMGPAGWASIAARTLMSSIGQQVIQQLGSQLGLPQPAIDLAQGAFAGSMGDAVGARQNVQQAVSGIGDMFGASPTEQGQAQGELNDAINKLVSSIGEGEDAKAARTGGKGGQSWLMALAEALGKKLDKMAKEMSSMADQITDKTPSLTAKFGAKTQEFSVLMNATTNAIKTVGEAEANSARKG